MVYEILLAVGVLGLFAMVLMGMVHGHGGDGHGHAGNGAHGHTDFGHGHADFGHAHVGAAHGHADFGHGHAGGTHGGGSENQTQTSVHAGPKVGRNWFAVSPLDLFSMALGAGAVGMALQTMLFVAPLAACAVAGGLAFDFLLVKPLIKFIFKFSSKPSEGLEGMIASPAEAISGFDASGMGLVKLTMDGEIVQLLAQLEKSEHSQGIKVHKGDQVIITEVDAQRGSCRVTRELDG